jgi:hypothetical protein
MQDLPFAKTGPPRPTIQSRSIYAVARDGGLYRLVGVGARVGHDDLEDVRHLGPLLPQPLPGQAQSDPTR